MNYHHEIKILKSTQNKICKSLESELHKMTDYKIRFVSIKFLRKLSNVILYESLSLLHLHRIWNVKNDKNLMQ